MSLPHRGAWVAIIATVVALCVDTLPVEHLVASQHSLFAAGDVNANAFHEIPADVAVVLGYSLDHGVPTRPLEARVRLGVRLFCSGRARNILFSGAEGENAGVLLTEAFAMASLAKTLLLMNHSLGDFDGKRGRCAPPLEKHPRRVAPHELGRRAVKDNRSHPVRVRELSVRDGSLETQTVQRGEKFVWVLEELSTSTRGSLRHGRAAPRSPHPRGPPPRTPLASRGPPCSLHHTLKRQPSSALEREMPQHRLREKCLNNASSFVSSSHKGIIAPHASTNTLEPNHGVRHRGLERRQQQRG